MSRGGAKRKHDYALADDGRGGVIVHKANCPDVRALAAQGQPVATLFGCANPLPSELARHSCLEGGR